MCDHRPRTRCCCLHPGACQHRSCYRPTPSPPACHGGMWTAPWHGLSCRHPASMRSRRIDGQGWTGVRSRDPESHCNGSSFQNHPCKPECSLLSTASYCVPPLCQSAHLQYAVISPFCQRSSDCTTNCRTMLSSSSGLTSFLTRRLFPVARSVMHTRAKYFLLSQ